MNILNYIKDKENQLTIFVYNNSLFIIEQGFHSAINSCNQG